MTLGIAFMENKQYRTMCSIINILRCGEEEYLDEFHFYLQINRDLRISAVND